MLICIVWSRSGLGRSLTVQGICWNTLNLRRTWHDISTMYFRWLKSPGVSARMWSVKLVLQFQESIRPYDGILVRFRSTWDLWWWVQVYQWSDWNMFRNTTEHRRELWMHPGAPGSASDTTGSASDKTVSAGTMASSAGNKSGSTDDMSGSTLNHRRAVWENQHLLWEHCWWARNS